MIFLSCAVAVQSHLGVGTANAEGSSNFFVGMTAQFTKDQNGLAVFRKPSDPGTEAIPHIFAGKRLLR